jgi:hypothetical protein
MPKSLAEQGEEDRERCRRIIRISDKKPAKWEDGLTSVMQCEKARGFGPDFAYCAEHAKEERRRMQ